MAAQEPFATTVAATPRWRADDGRLERGRRARARIREAARALFREKGFDATTLREIAARAGMGASSLYRHIRSKEELLVDEFQELQEEAWLQYRVQAAREGKTAPHRLQAFLDMQHELLARDPDLTTVTVRAMSHPEARVARHVLALQDRTVGLLAEILVQGRAKGELAASVDALAAARTITYTIMGARIAWANGLLDAEGCREAIETGVRTLFEGMSPA